MRHRGGRRSSSRPYSSSAQPERGRRRRAEAEESGQHLMSTPSCRVMATSRYMCASFDRVSPSSTSRETRQGVTHIPGATDAYHHAWARGRIGADAPRARRCSSATAAQCQPACSAHSVNGGGHRLLDRGGVVDHRVICLGTHEQPQLPGEVSPPFPNVGDGQLREESDVGRAPVVSFGCVGTAWRHRKIRASTTAELDRCPYSPKRAIGQSASGC
jgi:hypothetical protein